MHAHIFACLLAVLFTLSKEKGEQLGRYTVIKLILEYIQLLFLVAHPSYGWRIDPDNMCVERGKCCVQI